MEGLLLVSLLPNVTLLTCWTLLAAQSLLNLLSFLPIMSISHCFLWVKLVYTTLHLLAQPVISLLLKKQCMRLIRRVPNESHLWIDAFCKLR